MTFFKVTVIQCQITRKWYNMELYLQWPTNRKSYMIYQTAPFSMTLKDPYPSFKVTPFFDAECLRNGTRYMHSSNEILVVLQGYRISLCRLGLLLYLCNRPVGAYRVTEPRGHTSCFTINCIFFHFISFSSHFIVSEKKGMQNLTGNRNTRNTDTTGTGKSS